MRIPADVVRDGLAAIEQAAERMAGAQRQVATGRRLGRLSDDPAAVPRAVAAHATLRSIDACARTSDSASARLAAADQALASMVEHVSEVLTTVMSVRGSSTTPSARATAAQQILALRDALVADLNATFNGMHLFSGSRVTGPAYIQTGGAWVYQGDASAVRVEVAPGRDVAVTFDGLALVQGGDVDLLASIEALAAGVLNGDAAAIAIDLPAVERGLARLLRAQGRLGADEGVVDEAKLRLSTLRQAAESQRAAIEDANMAEAVTRLSQARTSYDAALAAVTAAERRTLLDYLR